MQGRRSSDWRKGEDMKVLLLIEGDEEGPVYMVRCDVM